MGGTLMGTLPTTGENLDLIGFELEEQPSYTHKLDIEGQRVAGMTDKREALRQAVYLILNVERYLDDLQTARLWAKVKALVSPLSSRVTTLEGQVQTNTTDLSGLATRVRTLELKYDTNVTGNSWSVAFTSLSGVVVTGVWNESQGRIEF